MTFSGSRTSFRSLKMKLVAQSGGRKYQDMMKHMLLFQPFLYIEIDIKNLLMLLFLLGTALSANQEAIRLKTLLEF